MSVWKCCARGYAVTVGKYGDKGIDFIAARGKEKLYVQVTYLLASEQAMEREFGVLEEIRDNYPKYVVSLDEFDRGRNGIRHRNIRDFLLENRGHEKRVCQLFDRLFFQSGERSTSDIRVQTSGI